MNSHESAKGFISFIILSAVIGLSVLSLKYISNSTNLISMASNRSSTPQYVEAGSVLNDSATISWYTNNSTIGILIYSDNKNCFEDKKNNYQNCELLSETESTKNHSIQIENLNPGTTYYYKIKGDSFVYPENEPSVFTTEDTTGFGTDVVETVPSTDPKSDELESEAIIMMESFENNEPASTLEESTPTTENNVTKDKNTVNDFDGFGEANTEQVLGISTTSKTQQKISATIIDEFREALVFNNLKYDFDKNGKVENPDYPLYIQFISNKED